MKQNQMPVTGNLNIAITINGNTIDIPVQEPRQKALPPADCDDANLLGRVRYLKDNRDAFQQWCISLGMEKPHKARCDNNAGLHFICPKYEKMYMGWNMALEVLALAASKQEELQ